MIIFNRFCTFCDGVVAKEVDKKLVTEKTNQSLRGEYQGNSKCPKCPDGLLGVYKVKIEEEGVA